MLESDDVASDLPHISFKLIVPPLILLGMLRAILVSMSILDALHCRAVSPMLRIITVYIIIIIIIIIISSMYVYVCMDGLMDG